MSDEFGFEYEGGMSRRSLLVRAGALSAVALGGSNLLAAAAQGAVHAPGGTLTLGIGGGGAGDSLDGTRPLSATDEQRSHALYDQIAQRDENYKLIMPVLEALVPNKDGSVWTMRLKPGIEFHNGKTATADDLIFSLQRQLDPKTGGWAQFQIPLVDTKLLKKVDARTVQVTMKGPFATFPDGLGDGGCVLLLPEGFDPKNPIGSGPFKFESFTPGQQSVFTRFANYHGGPAKIDRLVITNINDDSARVNALLAGQVDAINHVPAAQIRVIQANSQCRMLESKTGAPWLIGMNVATKPFNDVRVRQAMRLCLDRKKILQAALAGHGTIANDLYSPFDNPNPKLVRHHDPEQAKFLLKKAGKTNVRVELVTGPLASGAVECAQALAADAKKVGINVKVRIVDAATLYGKNWHHWPFFVDTYPANSYYSMVSTIATPRASGPNPSNQNIPKLNALLKQLVRTPNAKKKRELIWAMRKIEFDQGSQIIPYFFNSLDAYRTNTAGWPKRDVTYFGLNASGNYRDVSVQ